MYTTITPRHSFPVSSPFADLMNDRFFRSFFDLDHLVGSAGFRMDVRETPEAYHLEAELPGVKPEDINVSLENNVLTIVADYNTDRKDEQYLYSERRTGHMERSVELEGINQDAITADYENGVLMITLPRVKPAVPEVKKIAINGVTKDNTIKLEDKND